MRFPRPFVCCLLALSAAILLTPGSASAREPLDSFEVSVTGGYRFKGSADIDEHTDTTSQQGTVRYGGGPSFGASVGYRTEPDGFIYLWYSQQRANFETTPQGAADPTTLRDVTIHYLQFGGYLQGSYGPTVPYLGLSVGLSLLDPSDDIGNEIRPSGAVEGGMKNPITDHLSVRLLGRLPVTLMTGKTQIFCIDPQACKVSLDGKPIVQMELMGGLGVSF